MTADSNSFNLPDELLPHLIPANATFTRIHPVGRDPCWFGPAPGTGPSARFDAPAGEYRTLYGADRVEGAFAETALRRLGQSVVRDYAEARQRSDIRTLRALTLAKLYDNGLAWHGVTADILTGSDFAPSQALAATFFTKYSDLDGIAYRARYDNDDICYALFDRVDIADLEVVVSRPLANELDDVDGEDFDAKAFNSSAWTGAATSAEKIAAVKTLIPIAQAAVEQLIATLSGSRHNGGPPLDDTIDAIEALRSLHVALGKLLLAADEGKLTDASFDGMGIEIARYGKRALRNLVNDPVPYALSATILAILSACGLAGIGGYLAGVAVNMRKKLD